MLNNVPQCKQCLYNTLLLLLKGSKVDAIKVSSEPVLMVVLMVCPENSAMHCFDAAFKARDNSLRVWRKTTGKQSINHSGCREEAEGKEMVPWSWTWRSELRKTLKRRSYSFWVRTQQSMVPVQLSDPPCRNRKFCLPRCMHLEFKVVHPLSVLRQKWLSFRWVPLRHVDGASKWLGFLVLPNAYLCQGVS